MPQDVTKVRVFIASPSDVSAERGVLDRVIRELDTTIAAPAGYSLESVRWETHCAPAAGRAQAVITQQVGQYDVFVGIMAGQFGTSTGVADSGTEEEFMAAYRAWSDTGSPKIMFYFRKLQEEEARRVPQYKQVQAFKDNVCRVALVGEYESADAFADVVRPQLALVLQGLFAEAPRTAPTTTTASAVRLTPQETELMLSVPDSGEILLLEIEQESYPFIRAGRNGRHFPSRSDPAVAAVFGKALTRLVERGLVEHSTGMLYILTADGFSARTELVRLATYPDAQMQETLEVPEVLVLMLLARQAGDDGLSTEDVARELRLPTEKAKYFVKRLFDSGYIKSGWSLDLGYSIGQPGRTFLHSRGFL